MGGMLLLLLPVTRWACMAFLVVVLTVHTHTIPHPHPTHTHPPPFPQPTQVLSSNGGDDAALLRCLLPAVPPVEGAACTVNGRVGRLYAEKGFVASGQEQGQGDEEPVAVLPFGVEVGAYAVGGDEVGKGDGSGVLVWLGVSPHDNNFT